MKITIGAKICLLTTVLVLITAGIVSRWVLSKSVEHVIEHEVVDLADETELSAQRMKQSTTIFRQDFWTLAKSVPDNVSAGALLAGEPKKVVLEEWRDAAEKLVESFGDLVQVEIWAVAPDGRPQAAEPVAQVRKPSVRAVSEPTTQAELFKSIREEGASLICTSEFGQAEIVYDSDPDAGDLPGGWPYQRRLTLQLAIQVPPELHKANHGDTALVMVGTLHFRLLDSDLSRDEQTAVSPRHFLFVINSEGEFLQHPQRRENFDLKTRTGATLEKAGRELRKLHDDFKTFMNQPTSSEEAKNNKERGKTSKNAALESLHSWFGFSEILPKEMIDVLDWRIEDTDKGKQRSEFKTKLYALLREHPEYRTGMPSKEIPRFKLRCSSPRKPDVLEFQNKIADLLKDAGIPGTIQWNEPVELKTFAMHQVRMFYGGLQNDLYVDLAVAVSNEELRSDVDAEVAEIRDMALLGFGGGAAILAVLFSLIITRPLHKIITSTQRLGAGDFDVVLPVNDRGEIGDLARSFRNMADQIRERNRKLEEEREKVQELNQDLEKEKSLLEVRVNERTDELRKSAAELETARDAALEANRAKAPFWPR